MNRYSYAYNNPYKYIDEDGKNPVLVAYGVWKIWGTAVTSAPIFYQTATGDLPSWKQSLYTAGDLSLEILAPVTGDIPIALNTKAFFDDPKGYLEGKSGFTYAKQLENLIDKIPDEEEDEEDHSKGPFCKDCKLRYVIDDQNNIYTEVLNKDGGVIGRYSGGGGGGGSNVIPDPSGRTDRFGNPIYIPKPPTPPTPPPSPKPKLSSRYGG